MKNKKGFTLIELIAVIVILGLLMVIVIPAVSRYIDNSKKETYLKQINSLIDTVRYGINSGDNTYSMNGESSKQFDLKDVVLEKGSKTVKEGYLLVQKKKDEYKYYVLVSDEENNYCIALTDVNNLSKNNIVDCATMEDKEFPIGKKIWFAGSFWYVINDSKYKDSYVTLLKDSESGYMNFGESGIYANSVVKEFLNTEELNRLGSENLVEVDGYKIRLINETDLKDHLGFKLDREHNGDCPSNCSWLGLGNSKDYFRMPYDGAHEQYIGLMTSDGNAVQGMAAYYGYQYYVRPVINLLKTTIHEDMSKKEAYIEHINSLVDIVKNGVNDSNSKYYMGNESFKWFLLTDISSGDNVIKSGFVQVTKNNADYEYKVRVTNQNDEYCFKTTNINNLEYSDIIPCSNLQNELEYINGDSFTYNNNVWYVLEDSYYKDNYVKILRSTILTEGELGSNAISNKCGSYYASSGQYGCKTTSDKYATIKYSNSTKDNSYNNSLINLALNNYYLPILGEGNLEEIDGYKIKAMDSSYCNVLSNKKIAGSHWTSKSGSSGKAYACSSYCTGNWICPGLSEVSITSNQPVLPMINLKKAAIQ